VPVLQQGVQLLDVAVHGRVVQRAAEHRRRVWGGKLPELGGGCSDNTPVFFKKVLYTSISCI
jgi:hypothetical protein